VEAGAAQFQQFASQLGRRLQSQDPRESASKAKPSPIQLPFNHSKMGSQTSAMAREAEALKLAVVASNQVPPPPPSSHLSMWPLHIIIIRSLRLKYTT